MYTCLHLLPQPWTDEPLVSDQTLPTEQLREPWAMRRNVPPGRCEAPLFIQATAAGRGLSEVRAEKECQFFYDDRAGLQTAGYLSYLEMFTRVASCVNRSLKAWS